MRKVVDVVSAAQLSHFHTSTIPADVEPPNRSRARASVSRSSRGQQPVISRRGLVDASEVPTFVREALDEILAHIEKHHLVVEGPPFCIRAPRRGHQVDVEVGWPVNSGSAAGRISIGALPGGLARRGNIHGDAVL